MSDQADRETPGEQPSSGYSRRDATKIMALTAGALAVPLIVANQAPAAAPKPEDWVTGDVLVIGSGAAGLSHQCSRQYVCRAVMVHSFFTHLAAP